MDAIQNAGAGLSIPKFPLITQITGGLGGLWVLGGMTGTGKTTLARHFAYSLAGPKARVMYLDLEGNHRRDETTAGVLACYVQAVEQRANEYVEVERSFSAVERFIASRRAGEQAIVVIDHLQLLADLEWRATDKQAALEQIMATFVKWVDAGHIVLVLSQIPRTGYSQRPRAADFKGSGSIETAAHIAAGIWSPRQDDVRFVVVKARHVPLPSAEVQMARVGYDLREQALVPLSGSGASRQPKPKLSPVQRAFRGREEATLTTADIVRSLRMLQRWATAERYITHAVKAGEIVRVSKGAYTLPQIPAEIPA